MAIASIASGCAIGVPKGETALAGVDIVGAEQLDPADVEAELASASSPSARGHRPLWFETELYDPDRLRRDLARLEGYYRARGFIDARVRAARVVRTSERRVRVQIVIDEGPRVTVSAVTLQGLDGLPTKVRARVLGARHLEVGEPFDEDVHLAFARDAERILGEEGYARAKVLLRAEVDPRTRHARVTIDVAAGAPCTFGDVTIEGLRTLPADAVRSIVGIRPGDSYSTIRLRSARAALASLSTFESVEVEALIDDTTASAIPVRVSVREGRVRDVVVAPQLAFDPARDQISLRARWRDRNFLGGLRDLRAEAEPSMLSQPGLFAPNAGHVGVRGDVRLRQPHVLEPRTFGFARVEGAIAPDPVNAFRADSLGFDLGLDRAIGPFAWASFSYRRSVMRPYAYDGGALPAAVVPAGRASAELGALALEGTIDTRDDPRAPRRGLLATVSLQYAAASRFALGGDYGDLRLQPQLRLFAPISSRVVLALRFMLGFVLPTSYGAHFPGRRTPDPSDPSSYDADTSGDVPYTRGFFSGGPSSNRGYGLDEVGLRDCAKLADGTRQVGAGCSVIVGGASVWEGSVELRVDLGEKVTAVLFADTSDVSRDVFDVRLGYPHLSVGPGLRYETPVGPLRFDLGVRVPGAQKLGGELDPREAPLDLSLGLRAPFALHVSLGDEF